ncbi:hypothetical protein V6N12_006342 [Hibiscus sabdariffa]|uniref:RRM domain-containing protein n=1 Tax=Hibiscus sabdariffa TaxID=183260 RepID=A0ABR2EYJ3_9ROSI
MWAATSTPSLSFPSSLWENRRTHPSFKLCLRASRFDYPLASRIFVTIKLVRDEFTKRSKGYAFIQYTSQDEAMVAVENMDQQVFDGRMIHVEIAKLGKDRFRGCPKTSGPPSSKPQLQQPNDVADCCKSSIVQLEATSRKGSKIWIVSELHCHPLWRILFFTIDVSKVDGSSSSNQHVLISFNLRKQAVLGSPGFTVPSIY